MTPDEHGQKSDTAPENAQDKDQVVVPLRSEEVSVAKKRVVTGQVKVGSVTSESAQLIEELLEHEHVEIERTAIGKQVDKPPPVREEGDTLIIPIVEEIVVVERRLCLKEEVRVRRARVKQPYQEGRGRKTRSAKKESGLIKAIFRAEGVSGEAGVPGDFSPCRSSISRTPEKGECPRFRRWS